MSQRDERTLGFLFAKLGASSADVQTDGLDHHERDWYRSTFATA